MQVAEGIFQVQLPLPFPLRIVNCYMLRDGDGWTILDTGINYLDGRVAWQAAFADLEIAPKTIQRIILTHAHPDHFGMAGWLAELRAHHHERLEIMEQATGGGATAFSICTVVFPITALSPHQMRFAMAETLAHLEYLVVVGRLERDGGMYQRL